MKRIVFVVAMVVAMVAVGCGKGNKDGGKADSKDPKAKTTGASATGATATPDKAAAPAGAKPTFTGPGNDSVYDMALDDFTKAHEKLAKNEDPSLDCVTASSMTDGLKDEKDPQVKKFVADVAQFCGYDAPVKVIQMNLDKVAEAKKKDPNDPAIGPCAEIETTFEDLDKNHKDDATVKALHDKAKTACPE